MRRWVLVVTADGHGKRVAVARVPKMHRGGQGSIIGVGPLADAVIVTIGDEVLLATRHSRIERVAAAGVPVKGRRARGVRLVRLGPGDAVAKLAVVPPGLR